MRRDEGLAAGLVAVVMGGGVALAVANDIMAPACAAARSLVSNAKDFDFGCLEFWLNRYQAVAMGFLAAGIAMFALRPVLLQLAEARRQSSRGAKELAEEFATAIDAEIQAVQAMQMRREGFNLMLFDFEMHEQDEIADYIKDEGATYFDNVRKQRAVCDQNDRRQIGEGTFADMRQQFLTALDAFGKQVHMYVADLMIISRSSTRNPVRIEAAGKHAAAAKTALEALEASSKAYREALETLSKQKWNDVRRFEREAQGYWAEPH